MNGSQWRQWLRDITRSMLKNFDAYATILICTALLVVEIFGIASTSLVSEGILAVLILIAFSILQNRQASAKIEKSLEDVAAFQGSTRATDFFVEWNDDLFTQYLRTAREVSMFAVAPYALVNASFSELQRFFERKGTLRYLSVKPDGSAIEMCAIRSAGATQQQDSLRAQVLMSLRELGECASEASSLGSLQVKSVDLVPHAVIAMFDPQTSAGVILVTLWGFRQSNRLRPSFTLHREKDGRWYEFYRQSFENLWEWSGSEAIDLSKGSELVG